MRLPGAVAGMLSEHRVNDIPFRLGDTKAFRRRSNARGVRVLSRRFGAWVWVRHPATGLAVGRERTQYAGLVTNGLRSSIGIEQKWASAGCIVIEAGEQRRLLEVTPKSGAS